MVSDLVVFFNHQEVGRFPGNYVARIQRGKQSTTDEQGITHVTMGDDLYIYPHKDSYVEVAFFPADKWHAAGLEIEVVCGYSGVPGDCPRCNGLPVPESIGRLTSGGGGSTL